MTIGNGTVKLPKPQYIVIKVVIYYAYYERFCALEEIKFKPTMQCNKH